MPTAINTMSASSTVARGCGHPGLHAIVVHGLFEHTGRYVAINTFLRSLGFRVVSVTLPGHGTGQTKVVDWRSWDPVVASFVRAVRRVPYGAPTLVLGHSLGGLVVIDALRRGLVTAPTWIVLSAPYLRTAGILDFVNNYVTWLPGLIAPRVSVFSTAMERADTLTTDPYTNESYKNDPLVLTRLTFRTGQTWLSAQRNARQKGLQTALDRENDRVRKNGSSRILILRGDKDTIVSVSAIDKFADRLLRDGADVTLLKFEDEGHEMLFRPYVQEQIAAWWRRKPSP